MTVAAADAAGRHGDVGHHGNDGRHGDDAASSAVTMMTMVLIGLYASVGVVDARSEAVVVVVVVAAAAAVHCYTENAA